MNMNVLPQPSREIDAGVLLQIKADGRKTILIDSCPLFRHGFKSALHKAGFDVIAAESDLRSVRLDDHVPYSELMIIIGSSDDPAADVRALLSARARFPGSILVSLCEDCLPRQAVQLLRAGASTILPVPRDIEDFADVLDLVALGQRVIPMHLMASCIGDAEPEPEELPEAVPSRTFVDIDNKSIRLSIREVEILRCLLAGESNRSIAGRMDIGEATVKVHVKAILRKIKVKNRTQAAIWAISNMRSSPHELTSHTRGHRV